MDFVYNFVFFFGFCEKTVLAAIFCMHFEFWNINSDKSESAKIWRSNSNLNNWFIAKIQKVMKFLFTLRFAEFLKKPKSLGASANRQWITSLVVASIQFQ